MNGVKHTISQQIAQAAIAFQRDCTGVAPPSATVLLGEKTLVVTLLEALSPAQKEMAQTPEGAAQVREYHRRLFENSAGALHGEIQRILGVAVTESMLEMEPATGRLVELFPTGALVQVFRLSEFVSTQGGKSLESLSTEKRD